MLITIDTSALLAVLFNEKHRKGVIEATTGYDLQAPESLDAEIGNALSAMFKRNRISLQMAADAIKQFNKIPIRRTGLRLQQAVGIASKYDIYAYDAYMLDSANQYRTPLLTLDKGLYNVAQQMKINLVEVNK